MNKFQKLAQLNKDIELLENAGMFKAAEVLQRKFVREAQTDPFMGLSEIAKKYMLQLDEAYNQKKPVESIINNAYNDDTVTENDKNILAVHADKIKNQYSSNEAYAGQNNAYTMATPSTNNSVPAAQQQTSPAYSDTANQMQAQNTLPGDAEPRLYQSSIQMIANLLNTKMPENRTKAQQIYENTIGQFTNEKRKQAFARQFQAIVSRNFPAGQIQ
jgi:hypothetical protein